MKNENEDYLMKACNAYVKKMKEEGKVFNEDEYTRDKILEEFYEYVKHCGAKEERKLRNS